MEQWEPAHEASFESLLNMGTDNAHSVASDATGHASSNMSSMARARSNSISTSMGNLLLASRPDDSADVHHQTNSLFGPKAGKSVGTPLVLSTGSIPGGSAAPLFGRRTTAGIGARRASIADIHTRQLQSRLIVKMSQNKHGSLAPSPDPLQDMHAMSHIGELMANDMDARNASGAFDFSLDPIAAVDHQNDSLFGGPMEPSMLQPRPAYCSHDDWTHINAVVSTVVTGSKAKRRRHSIAAGGHSITPLARLASVPKDQMPHNAEPVADEDLVFEFLDKSLFSGSDSQETLCCNELDDGASAKSASLPKTYSSALLQSPLPVPLAADNVQVSHSPSDKSAFVDTNVTSPEFTSAGSPASSTRSPIAQTELSATDGSETDTDEKPRHDSAPVYDPVRPLLCPHSGCGKRFTNKMNLRSHLRIHDSVKNYPCTLCPAEFRRCHDLKRHVRSLHTGVKPYLCDQCGKRFSRADALKRHLERESTRCYNPVRAQQLGMYELGGAFPAHDAMPLVPPPVQPAVVPGKSQSLDFRALRAMSAFGSNPVPGANPVAANAAPFAMQHMFSSFSGSRY